MKIALRLEVVSELDSEMDNLEVAEYPEGAIVKSVASRAMLAVTSIADDGVPEVDLVFLNSHSFNLEHQLQVWVALTKRILKTEGLPSTIAGPLIKCLDSFEAPEEEEEVKGKKVLN